jgi:hypothetical protein
VRGVFEVGEAPPRNQGVDAPLPGVRGEASHARGPSRGIHGRRE